MGDRLVWWWLGRSLPGTGPEGQNPGDSGRPPEAHRAAHGSASSGELRLACREMRREPVSNRSREEHSNGKREGPFSEGKRTCASPVYRRRAAARRRWGSALPVLLLGGGVDGWASQFPSPPPSGRFG